jgi:dCMP deaminase
MKEKWISAYIDIAERISMLSNAKRLKVGAIIVKDHRIISMGYNGTPTGWDNVCEDENNKTKPEVIHAEMNCIQKLAKSNESGEDSIMFITHAPCMSCAKAIYGSGIKGVFYKNLYRNDEGLKFLNFCNIYTIKV